MTLNISLNINNMTKDVSDVEEVLNSITKNKNEGIQGNIIARKNKGKIL